MAKRPTKPQPSSEPQSRPADDRLEAGPGAGNEPVVGGGPGKVQDGDLQMRTQGAMARGDQQAHRENLAPEVNKQERYDPHEHLKKIVEAKKARKKQD